MRELNTLEVLGHVGIGEHVEDVTCLVAVVNPGGLRLHLVPQRARGNVSCTVAPAGNGHGVATRLGSRGNVRRHRVGHVLGVPQTVFLANAKSGGRTVVLQKHLVEAVERVSLHAGPVGIVFLAVVAAASEPASAEHALAHLPRTEHSILDGVVQVLHAGIRIGAVMHGDSRNTKVVVE